MCGRECISNDYSLLIIKPEAKIARVDDVIMRDVRATGLVKCEIPQVRFSEKTASQFWSDLEGLYPWVSEYYKHMASGPCTAIVVDGMNSGVELKKVIRAKYQDVISKLQTELGLDFQPDLIHGSDPGQMGKEIVIVCSSATNL